MHCNRRDEGCDLRIRLNLPNILRLAPTRGEVIELNNQGVRNIPKSVTNSSLLLTVPKV
jgi:hypothetical protein